MLNEAFGQHRSLSNIPRPPSSRIRSPFWNQTIAQNALNNLVLANTAEQLPADQHMSTARSPDSSQRQLHHSTMHFSNVHPHQQQQQQSHHGSRPNSRSSRLDEFKAMTVPTPPVPLQRMPVVPRSRDAAEEIMGHQTPAEYVRSSLDSFEAMKRRHLAATTHTDHSFPDLEQMQQKLRTDKFALHDRNKERIRGSAGKTRNEKITDGYVNFRGRSYVRYIVPLESTMTRTMRWLFDLRELNVHPVTRMMREHGVTVEHFSQEWLRHHVGASKEAGTSILGEALSKFVQDHILKSLYVTTAQCLSWYELLCDKKGTSLDFAAAMTKLALTLPPEIDDSISAWFTRMIFSGAYIMFRAGDNATPSEFYYIVDALETLVDNKGKRGAVEHRLRETPVSSTSSSGAAAAAGGGKALAGSARLAQDEFDTTTPQGIMRLLSVVRADIDAYANAISSRAVRRVDDVLAMFSEEGTLRRLMLCGEYAASTAHYHAMATKRLHAAKQARERAIQRSKSILMGRRVSAGGMGGEAE